ncbi:succinate dehydrogenase [Pelagibius sp.]|uniref:succinate dehydrogenase n=1 Tax=Pelagibius sp. TaxID=1931238 RepID=UPI00260F9AD4|nr:succinate dehydrogenase [Pelagibius sp.]
MTERRLFVLQRLTALILAPLVLAHLGLILYAVRDGLTAQEILGRTQGSLGWALFYGAFVLAAAVHAPLGLRTILREWTAASPRLATLVSLAFGILLAALGLRAVIAVVA